MSAKQPVPPQVSIIVPIFNTEQYLSECIQSILSQTFSNFEVILVDDGSTDGSMQLCHYYQDRDSRIQVIHTTNQGVSHARSIGFKAARGEWIRFVDSDDFLPETSLEVLLHDSSDVDVVIGNISTHFEGRVLLSKYTEGMYIRNNYISGICRGTLPQMLPPILVRRSILNAKMLDVPRSIPVGEDLIISLRIANNSSMACCIPDIVYQYNKRRETALARKTGDDYLTAFYGYFDECFSQEKNGKFIIDQSLHLRFRDAGKMIQRQAIRTEPTWLTNIMKARLLPFMSTKERILFLIYKSKLPPKMQAIMYSALLKVISYARRIINIRGMKWRSR